MDIIEIFKALSDETRIRILNLLRKDTLCVCDIEEVLKISQSNASRHLAKLRIARIITGEKKAQWVYYQIDDNILAKHSFLKELFTRELYEHPQFQKDLARLERYREHGGSCEMTVNITDE